MQHRIFDIHGLNGEHAYLANTSLPSTPRRFSYSRIQLFEDDIDQDRFAQVATKLLDKVAEATLSKSRDVSHALDFLLCYFL